MNAADFFTIGELAARSGAAPSALRFYEDQGLIASERTAGNQRRYRRAMLRRVAVIQAARAVGVSLQEIGTALQRLPNERTPTKRDWERLSFAWRSALDARIAALEHLRADLTGCIGCGCLSLRRCVLLNPGDVAATAGGTGPRYLLRNAGGAEEAGDE